MNARDWHRFLAALERITSGKRRVWPLKGRWT